jgi:hypothetical protein
MVMLCFILGLTVIVLLTIAIPTIQGVFLPPWTDIRQRFATDDDYHSRKKISSSIAFRQDWVINRKFCAAVVVAPEGIWLQPELPFIAKSVGGPVNIPWNKIQNVTWNTNPWGVNGACITIVSIDSKLLIYYGSGKLIYDFWLQEVKEKEYD